MTKPENTIEQQLASDGKPSKGGFRPGQSGNPKGRPKGARNKATLLAEQLLDGEAEAITRTVIALALDGDTTALKLCLERLLPPRKRRPLKVPLQLGSSAEDVASDYDALLSALADGELDIDEAALLSRILEAKRGAIETAHLEQELTIIKDQLRQR